MRRAYLPRTNPEDPQLELLAAAPRERASAALPWRELLAAWPRAPRPLAGKPAAVEYVLQTTPLARSGSLAAPDAERLALVDDRACAVLMATVTGGKDGAGAVQRRYGGLDPARLATEDLEIQTLLFGVEELVEVGRLRGEPFLRPSPGRRVAARIAAPRAGEILPRLAASGRFGWLPDPSGPLAPLRWDARGPWALEVSIVPGARRGWARVTGALVRGEERRAAEAIRALAGGGVAIAGERALEVVVDGLGRWLHLLAHDLALPLADVPAFVARTCDAPRPPRIVLRT